MHKMDLQSYIGMIDITIQSAYDIQWTKGLALEINKRCTIVMPLYFQIVNKFMLTKHSE